MVRDSGGLRFWRPVQKIRGAPFLYGACENLLAPSMRKCCDSDIFSVHQYTNWYPVA